MLSYSLVIYFLVNVPSLIHRFYVFYKAILQCLKSYRKLSNGFDFYVINSFRQQLKILSSSISPLPFSSPFITHLLTYFHLYLPVLFLLFHKIFCFCIYCLRRGTGSHADSNNSQGSLIVGKFEANTVLV